MSTGAAGPWPLEHHRLLGDGTTAALLRPDGVIDWWCTPRFDSPPLLWSLLDEERGASASFVGTRPVSGTAEQPAAGPTATTFLHAACGRVEVRDGLLSHDGSPCLVRLVRGTAAPLDVEHDLRVGGFGEPVPGPGAPAGTLRLRLQAATGVWTGLVVREVGSAALSGQAPELFLTTLTEAQARADAEIDACRLPRHLPGRAAEALRVLQACTDVSTGAPVASPTTSLPEAVGADRQFDYRFSWLRDASLAMATASLLGRIEVAARHLAFLQRVCAGGVPAVPVTDTRGGDVPDEIEVHGVAGWGGSLPVRVGNDAKTQLQYDVLGIVCESVWVLSQQGVAIDGLWPVVTAIADKLATEVLSGQRPPSAGMWELREPEDLVSADIGRWVALDRAVRLTRLRRPWAWRPSWSRARRVVRDRVVAALRPDGGLPRSYAPGDSRSDAVALLAVVFGLLDRRDPRATALVDATLKTLGGGAFLWRYEPGGDDGFHGVEGAFLPCSWWAVSALALVGRVDEARVRALALDAALPPLLPEEWDPARGAGLGNVPLVWSHGECARALYLLDDAARRRRVGTVGNTVWRIWRGIAVRSQGGQ